MTSPLDIGSLSALLRDGGGMLPVLLLAALVSLTLVVNRVWFLRRAQVAPRRLIRTVERHLEKGQTEEIQKILRNDDSPLAAMLLALLEENTMSPQRLLQIVEIEGRFQYAHLQRHLGLLGSIASIAPLLGLLGTVFGIVRAFSALGHPGGVAANTLAGGIAEALISTAAGLAVAIPTLLAYRALRSQAEALALRLRRETLRLATLWMLGLRSC